MRIIAGAHRGRKLKVPKRDVRPTADRVKEAAFSILSDAVVDAKVLDLFAGSGSLGLEALSRGAARVDFVEIARASEKVLRANIELIGATDTSELIRADALRFVAGLDVEHYDLALADPPYNQGLSVKLRDLFLERRFAKILCIEHRVGELEGANDVRRYGETQLSFFRSS